jgi:hypothetical protein
MPNSHTPSGQPLPGWGQKLRKTSRTAVALATLAGLTLSVVTPSNKNGHTSTPSSDITLQGEL